MSDTTPSDFLSDPSGTGICTYFRGLKNLLAPRSVAVIGATERERSVGRTIVHNLQQCRETYPGGVPFELYPVNPRRTQCCGLPCYPSVDACPRPVDLALIVTPVSTVIPVMDSCGRANVSVVIIITAGFKETGPQGEKMEQDVMRRAFQYRIRVIGPNCLGVMSPHWGMNASFAATDALPGGIAFMSQSGAMCTAVLDWSRQEHVGFSAFVSLGSMADIDWGELIEYFGDDPNTHTLLIYMETVGRPQHLLSVALRVAPRKPIIVIKAGQTEAAAQAAVSHTGSLAGSHAAFVAAMQRAGILVVDTIAELFDTTLLLGKQPRPEGPRLLIITNAGGPGVLTTDAAALGGAQLPPLAASTLDQLNSFLPPAWSHGNPVDILGDASAELYARTLQVCLQDTTVDGILVVLSPQSVTDATGTARVVIEAYQKITREAEASTGPPRRRKPLLCSWMGGVDVREGAQLLNAAGIPNYSHPDAAARTFARLWTHYNATHINATQQEALGAAKHSFSAVRSAAAARPTVDDLLQKARQQDRTLLTEAESKAILRAYGIPVAEAHFCTTAEEAEAAAVRLGTFPLVAKLHSETLTHKSDVGGVILSLMSPKATYDAFHRIRENVAKAVGLQHFGGVTIQPMYDIASGYELIIGSHVDNQFGPLILFGSGGKMVEIFNDTVLGLPPMTPAIAQRMISETRIAKALKGDHGQRFVSVDMEALSRLVSLFSTMIVDLAMDIHECDINPLLVTNDSLVALDARIVLREPHDRKTLRASSLLAIKDYPNSYQFTSLPPLFTNDAASCLRVASPMDLPVLQLFFNNYHELPSEDCFGLPVNYTSWLNSVALSDYVQTLTFLGYSQRTESAPNNPDSLLPNHTPPVVLILQRVPGTLDAGRLILYTHTGSSDTTSEQIPLFQKALTAMIERVLEVARHEELSIIAAHMPGVDATATKLLLEHALVTQQQPFVMSPLSFSPSTYLLRRST